MRLVWWIDDSWNGAVGVSKPETSQERAPKAVRIFDGEYYVMAINAISVQEDPLSGQLPSDKELASEGPEARQGARPEVGVRPPLPPGFACFAYGCGRACSLVRSSAASLFACNPSLVTFLLGTVFLFGPRPTSPKIHDLEGDVNGHARLSFKCRQFANNF